MKNKNRCKEKTCKNHAKKNKAKTNLKEKMKADVIGDIVCDVFLKHVQVNGMLNMKTNIPIINKEMMETQPIKAQRLLYAFYSGNFNAVPHPGMTLKDMIDDRFDYLEFK